MLHTDASFDVADFDQRLVQSALAEGGPDLGPTLLHTIEAGGKRIRALLVHEFGALTGAPGATTADIGLAIEFLHAATLVHDDVIDRAETRRGRPALQREYGVEVALLVGDLYVARCGVHLARAAVPAAAGEIWKALDTIVRGEIDQRSHRFDFAQTAADYLATVQRKTASLLEAGCAAGVLAGGGEDELVEAARSYGRHLGLAFQVVDDVLDYSGRPDEMGKPVGNDIREGTVTLPLILALEMSTAPLRQILASARERSDFGAVVMAVQRSGAIDRCLEMADEHSIEAVAALQAFPAGADRDALEALAQALPSRRA
ncbi:MAG TPA: polyprenyl synthetase family protein [Candidatus Solibacter sp.]|nr:polyprenyl synthetase family protein [Candidatus Solibacter sp.]